MKHTKSSKSRKTYSTITKKTTTNKSRRTKCKTPTKSHIVRTFLEMINVVKLYHWKTHSYDEHKATDELHSNLNEHVDKFVEVFLGKDKSRIQNWDKKMEIIQFESSVKFKERVYEYREFLMNLSRCLDTTKDSDLLNIRDEILGDLNQFLYLLTFK